MTHTHQQWEGPIPPSSELKGYNEAVPDAADRILSMAEKEQQHRHRLHHRELSDLAERHRSIDAKTHRENMAAIVSMPLVVVVLVTAGAGLIAFGFPVWGGTTLGLSIATFVWAILTGNRRQGLTRTQAAGDE